MVNNVIRSGSAIKGSGSRFPQIIVRRDVPWLNGSAGELALLEQLFGRRPVGFRALHVGFDTRDLGLQRFDPLLQLFNRQRIKILPRKRDQRILGLAREEVFEVHGANC
jgi:hypothetical protein